MHDRTLPETSTAERRRSTQASSLLHFSVLHCASDQQSAAIHAEHVVGLHEVLLAALLLLGCELIEGAESRDRDRVCCRQRQANKIDTRVC